MEEVHKKICKKCGKVIRSLYKKQLDYNYEAHLLSCKNSCPTNSKEFSLSNDKNNIPKKGADY